MKERRKDAVREQLKQSRDEVGITAANKEVIIAEDRTGRPEDTLR